MLTRAELCTLTRQGVDRFKALSRRGLLPFLTDYEVGQSSADVAETTDRLGWRRYTWLQALQLVLMDDLIREQGLAQEAASKAISNSLGYLAVDGDLWTGIADAREDLWIGVVLLDHEGGAYTGRAHVAGTMGNIATEIVKIQSPQRVGDGAARVALVNVSHAYRRLIARASEAGLLEHLTDGR